MSRKLKKDEKVNLTAKEKNEIIKKYGTVEEFLYKYKKGEFRYWFEKEAFVGPRAVAISSKEITEMQKLGYYNLLSNINHIDNEKLCRIDIDETEYMLSNANIEETSMEWLRLYYGIAGEKSSFEEIGEKYEVDIETVQKNILQIIMYLKEPNVFRKSCVTDISSERVEGLQSKLEDINEFEKSFSNEFEKAHTDENGREMDVYLFNELLTLYDVRNVEEFFENKRNVTSSLEDCLLYPEQLEYYLNEENIFDPNTIIPSVERELTLEDNSEEMVVDEEKKQGDIGGDLPIEYFEFQTRTYKCLRRSGIDTINELCNRIVEDGEVNFDSFKKIRNFGEGSLKEMIDKLVAVGLLKKNEKGEFELQPDRLYPEKHSVSEVGDAVSNLTESQVYGTLKEMNEKAQKENPEQQSDKSINEEN